MLTMDSSKISFVLFLLPYDFMKLFVWEVGFLMYKMLMLNQLHFDYFSIVSLT